MQRPGTGKSTVRRHGVVLQGKTWKEDGRTGVAGNSTRRIGRGIGLRCGLV